MRRRSAGARTGDALAARGQHAGSAWAALGSDLALWRARIRRLHGFCESGIRLPSNGLPIARSSSHYVAGRSVVAARPDLWQAGAAGIRHSRRADSCQLIGGLVRAR